MDTALLTLDPEQELVVLQVRRTGTRGWALPGTFLWEGERLADAVKRSLREKAGVRGLHPRQLHVFDDSDRDDRGWVLSVAHVAVVPAEALATRFAADTRLVPVTAPGRLIYDHRDIIALAVTTSAPGTARRRTPTGCSGTVHPARLTAGARGGHGPGVAARHLSTRHGTPSGGHRGTGGRGAGAAGGTVPARSDGEFARAARPLSDR